MGYVQIPDDLKAMVERQVADGRAASEADFIAEAVRLYLGYLGDDRLVAAMAEQADADMAAGRHVTIATADDSEVIHQRTVDRLRTNLAKGAIQG